MEKEKQAAAKKTVKIEKTAFEKEDHTCVSWLGNGGAFINSRGVCIMLDPLLDGFDMPLLAEPPIRSLEVPFLDAVLITHSDNDHFNETTCKNLKDCCKAYHATRYVAGLMKEIGIAGIGHGIHEEFQIEDVEVKVTPADHAWQNEILKGQGVRTFRMEDFCGYWLETLDCTVWMPGDSRLMEEQLHYPQPDVILLDFSESRWHIGLDGAARLAQAYPNAVLIPIHWGCVRSDMPEFSGNPDILRARITNPDRLLELAPGEALRWREHKLLNIHLCGGIL